MADATPSRSSPSDESIVNADYTRPQEADTPSNLNQRSSKRQQRVLNNLPPPKIDYKGGGAINNTVAAALNGQLNAYEQEARVTRLVYGDFARNVDSFVASYQQPGHRKVACDIAEKFVEYISNALRIEINGANLAPLQTQSQRSAEATSSALKVTFAEVAKGKTLTNSGADAKAAKAARSSAPGKTDATKPKKEDRRILIAIEPSARLDRPEPFALRRELCARIQGLTLAAIPLITATASGWALTPSDHATRDLLMSQENTEILTRTMRATDIRLPEKWYNYAVTGVPFTMRQLVGASIINTAELITEEVCAQTKARPVSCRPSRHGPNPATNKITWIVSFLQPVRPFRLFNAGETSKLIEKRQPVTRHNPGCQGYCNPAKCTRYARCSHCATRVDQHAGQHGANCTEAPKCANCHGPFPAGHEHCPAVPRRKNGKLVRLSRKELDAVRRHGDKEFRDSNLPPAPETPAASQQPQGTQLQPQAQGSEANVMSTQAQKRKVDRITAHEAAGPCNARVERSAVTQSTANPQTRTHQPPRSLDISRDEDMIIDDEPDELTL